MSEGGQVPARVSLLSRETIVASTGSPVRERERNIYATLSAGTYVVMCAAFMAGMEGSFKVSEGRGVAWRGVRVRVRVVKREVVGDEKIWRPGLEGEEEEGEGGHASTQ